ncbi:sperm-egg fusion protein TMEM95 isoform X2 [Ranitomeya variabilis]|uniref:sperm-egg fusion protein TMEM95 isoform X2 n=1 Tax=Ranitomeya variabilis TaxID=490064 RepID=UPI004055A7B7
MAAPAVLGSLSVGSVRFLSVRLRAASHLRCTFFGSWSWVSSGYCGHRCAARHRLSHTSPVSGPCSQMWPLRLVPVLLLLTSVSGCVFCRRHDRNLRNRFEKLCEAYKAVKGSDNCTRHPGPRNFHKYGLEEDALLFITEKTHRVFRVLEINRDQLGIAAYWDWLHEVKLLEYTKEVLCPPMCSEKTLAMNCSLCRLRWMQCWDHKICYPGTRTMYENVLLLLYCSLVSLLLGLLICGCTAGGRPRFGDERPLVTADLYR